MIAILLLFMLLSITITSIITIITSITHIIIIVIESVDWFPSTVIYSHKLELFDFDITILCIASRC